MVTMLNPECVAKLDPDRDTADLISIFNNLFAEKYNTRLERGESKAVYLPADEIVPYHRLIFAQDVYSSALHEIAHWCIAGKERRQVVGFGYHNQHEGLAMQQQAFKKAEVKPQALEWILSKACQHSFRASMDDQTVEKCEIRSFKDAIFKQVICYCHQGLPKRAGVFRKALCECYKSPCLLRMEQFSKLD